MRNAQHGLLKTGHLVPYEYLSTIMTRTWGEMQSNPAFAHLAGIEDSTANIADSILRKHWYTLEACAGGRFIASDSSVITMKLAEGAQAYLGFGFSQHDVAVALPISPKKLFIASPRNICWQKMRDQNNINLLNRSIAQFAERSIYADIQSNEIQELADKEINQIKYGENAFNLLSSP